MLGLLFVSGCFSLDQLESRALVALGLLIGSGGGGFECRIADQTMRRNLKFVCKQSVSIGIQKSICFLAHVISLFEHPKLSQAEHVNCPDLRTTLRLRRKLCVWLVCGSFCCWIDLYEVNVKIHASLTHKCLEAHCT